MRFERYPRTVLRPITGRRLSAARRALQRETDEVALFPDLQPTETPQQRIARLDANAAAHLEITRTYAQASRITGKGLQKEFPGVKIVKTWYTNNDDLVCEICATLDGMTVEIDEGFSTEEGEGLDGPPAHPNCRCWRSDNTSLSGL